MSAINEFKLTGAGYIAKNGNSVNAGTDPTLPKAHPADFPSSNNILILGSGYYLGGWTNNRVLRGDGYAVVDFNGAGGSIGTGNVNNIYFKNKIGSLSGFGPVYNTCVFENVTGAATGLGGFIECIFLTDFNYTDIGRVISRSIITGLFSYAISFTAMNGSYLSKNGVLWLSGVNSGFANNCINGKIRWTDGVLYESKRVHGGGTRLDSDPTIPDIINVYPNFYDQNNFSGDPKFINFFGKIVAPDSDLLKWTNGSVFIGGVRPGTVIQARNNTDPNTDITLFNVVEAGNGYMVAPGENWGRLTIVTRESSSVVELGAKSPITPLNFDSAVTPGATLNNNVPDSWPLTDPGGNPGKLPNRLTYLLRTSQRNTKPTQDSHWDNDAAAGGIAGEYYVQEWFTKPTLTQLLGNTYGNAEPEGYGGTVNPINARWSEYTIYLRNDRNF